MNRLLLLLWLTAAPAAWANNLQLTSASQPNALTVLVEVAWENSWWLPADVAPGNHDAVWLFGRYRDAAGAWQPLRWSSTTADHTAEGALAVVAVADGLGTFVRRAALGDGSAAGTVTLRLATPLPSGAQALRLFGVEMAYVAPGPFAVGDGASNFALRRGDADAPLEITSEALLPVGNTPDALFTGSPDADRYPAEALPAAFPKGFGGFYLMKHEITQEQYADFVNTLTFAQQTARLTAPPDSPVGTPALGNGSRNGLVIVAPGAPGTPAVVGSDANADGVPNEPTDAQARACNFLNGADVLAYLDWAGLRPITELEYEKAARGPSTPTAKAFAWDSQQFVNANTPLSDGTAQETAAEQATATAGLANAGGTPATGFLLGPLRAGFGADATGNRHQAGAGYYGATELSGNLWELCVSVLADGPAFGGTPGDGRLSATGSADVPGWPDPTGLGATWRGGGWNSLVLNDLDYEFRDLAVSDRFYSNLIPTLRRNTAGGRGGRSF